MLILSVVGVCHLIKWQMKIWLFLSKVNPKPVVALVADQDLIFGLARMWELLIDAAERETMVFRKREDAEAWITQKVKEKYGIDDVKFG
jgi:hypothetical protein